MPRAASSPLLLASPLAGGRRPRRLAAGTTRAPRSDIALTAAQAKYTALTGSGAAAKPSADKRRGYRSGWQVAYLKGTATKPVAALRADLRLRDDRRREARLRQLVQGLLGDVPRRGREHEVPGRRRRTSTPGVIDIATCRNVYVAVVVSGKITRQRARAGGRRARRRRVRQGDGRRHVALQDRLTKLAPRALPARPLAPTLV